MDHNIQCVSQKQHLGSLRGNDHFARVFPSRIMHVDLSRLSLSSYYLMCIETRGVSHNHIDFE